MLCRGRLCRPRDSAGPLDHRFEISFAETAVRLADLLWGYTLAVELDLLPGNARDSISLKNHYGLNSIRLIYAFWLQVAMSDHYIAQRLDGRLDLFPLHIGGETERIIEILPASLRIFPNPDSWRKPALFQPVYGSV